jgi:hypothetical protein
MRTILTALFAVLLFVLGCWTPGEIQENLPKHRNKFPAGTVFFVDKTEPRVTRALVEALRARGFKVTPDRAQASVAIETKIKSWEYNDAGFSGFYDRDEMTLAIQLRQPTTGFVLARHTVTVCSDFRILAKYVDSL